MRSSSPILGALGAVQYAWPGALRVERSADELRHAMLLATQELVDGRTGTVESLFAEMRSPAPRLRWTPDEASLGEPRLRLLSRYWKSRLRGSELPLSSGIDPLDLVPALGYLMLLEPNADASDFRYRLYGSRIVEYAKVDMTGKHVRDIPAPLVAAYFVATYRATAQRREMLYAHHRTHHDIQTAEWDRLILPFVDDRGVVDRLLVGNVPRLVQGAEFEPDMAIGA